MKHRQLLYLPEIKPDTFLLFYFKGDTGRSYSFRDYSVTTDPPRLTYAEAYPFAADEILSMARWHFDAEIIPTGDVAYWRGQIAALNRRFLGELKGGENLPQPALQTAAQRVPSSTRFSLLSSSGQTINSVEDWFLLAPPKMGAKHWKDGRSAKELAKAFCTRGACAVPPEVAALLASSQQLGSVQLTHAWPEHKIQLDSYWGETRNADLAAVGQGNLGTVAVTLEAKADEPFGRTIAAELLGAKGGSNLPKRILALCQSVLDRPPSAVGGLRYQLLHAVAATLIYAKEQGAAAAVFVVYEFHGPSCSAANLKHNAADLDAFVAALAPSAAPLEPGQLAGPFCVPGGGRVPSGLPLYIGKASRLLP